MCLVGSAWILYLDRNLTFFFDEWDIINVPTWSLARIMAPHNVHIAIMLRAVYIALLNINGIRSYIPYIVVLLTLHGASAFMIFAILRNAAGSYAGLIGCATLLIYGPGAQNLVWAFQIGWVASILFGLLSWWLLTNHDSGKTLLIMASVFLVIAVLFSTIGIFMLIGIAIHMVAAGKWKMGKSVFPALIIYLTWLLIYGKPAANDLHFHIINVAQFVYDAFDFSIKNVLGLSSIRSPAVGIGFIGVLIGTAYLSKRVEPLSLGALGALLGQLSLTALGRSDPKMSRYQYVAAVFVILMAVPLLRQTNRNWWIGLSALGLALVPLWHNARTLAQTAHEQQMMADAYIPELQAALSLRGHPGLRNDRVIDSHYLPQLTAGELYTDVDRYGYPVQQVAAAILAVRRPVELEYVIWNLVAVELSDHPAAVQTYSVKCGTPVSIAITQHQQFVVVANLGKVAFLALDTSSDARPFTYQLDLSKSVFVSIPFSDPIGVWHIRVAGVDGSEVCVGIPV